MCILQIKSSCVCNVFDPSSATTKRNLTKLYSKASTSSTKFVFFGQIRKQRWPSWPLIDWEIFTSPLQPLNGIWRNLTGSKVLNTLYKDGRPGLWFDEYIFDSSTTVEWNSRKLNMKQVLITSSTKLVFLGADPSSKMTALTSDWLRHVWIVLCNFWTEFDQTSREASRYCALNMFCF